MGYPHLATLLYNSLLMITPEKAEVIEAVFRAYAEGRMHQQQDRAALLSPTPTQARQRGYSVTDAGVAVVPIMGTLVQRGSNMDAESGLSGYSKIAANFDEAMHDSNVRGVVLEIDSPGGQVAGMFDLAAKIHAASKPVYASANESAMSAAYVLGSAAQKLYVPEPGMVGSIGVRMMHVDQSQADAKRGYAYTPIFAGARKNDLGSHAPLTSDALAAAQRTVDHTYALMVDAVAKQRRLDPGVVRATEAGIFHASHAVSLGLADGVGSFDNTVQLMTEAVHASPLSTYGLRAESAQLGQETQMADIKEATIEVTAAVTEQQLAQERAVGTKAATERVKAVLTCEAAKDRPSLAQHLAFDTDLSAEQAQALLAKAAPEVKANVNPLAAAMSAIANPRVGADAESSDPEADAARQIINAGKKVRLVPAAA